MAEHGRGIPVVVAGLGEVGRAIARSVLETPELRLVGAIDLDPALTGKALEAILGAPCPGWVAAEPRQALDAAEGGVLLQATTSSFEWARSQIEQAVRALKEPVA